jgi:hypothetical protein
VTPRRKNKNEANHLQMAFKKDGEAFGLDTTKIIGMQEMQICNILVE